MIDRNEGDLASAREKLYESLAVSERLTLKQGSAGACLALSWVERDQGFFQKAKELAGKGLRTYREIGCQHRLVAGLVSFAKRAILEEKWSRALKILGALDALQLIPMSKQKEWLKDNLAAIRIELPEKAFQVAWKEWQAMNIDQVIEYALTDENSDST